MGTLFDTGNLAVALFEARRKGQQFLITDLSRTAEQDLGRSRESAIGRTPLDVFPAAIARLLAADLGKAWKSAAPVNRSRLAGQYQYSVWKLASGGLLCLFLTSGRGPQEMRSAAAADSPFQQIADNLDEMIWLMDARSHRMIYLNLAYDRLFGRPRTELLRNPLAWLEYVHPEDRERVRSTIFDESETHMDFVCRTLLPDSSIKWVHARTFAVPDAGGKLSRIVVIAEDVTEKTRISRELASSEKRFRSLFAESPASLWELDLSAVKIKLDTLALSGIENLPDFLKKNPAEIEEVLSLLCVVDVSGVTLTLFAAATKADILDDPKRTMTDESRLALIEAFATLHRGEELSESVSSWRTFAGDEVDLVMRLTVASGSETSWREVLLSFTDITDLKRKERELEESEEKFRIISEQSQIGICIVQDGRMVYANKAFTDLTRFTSGNGMDLGAQEEGKLFHGDEMFHFMKRLGGHTAAPMEDFSAADVPLTTVNGEQKWFNVFMKTVSIGGRPAGMAALIDITKEKRAREQARDRQKQLIQADKLASLGVLAAGVAHEINNPNQAIILSSQVLLDAWADVKQILDGYVEANGDFALAGVSYSQMREMLSNCISAIRDCSTKIETIVGDLKGFARQDVSEAFHPLDINMAVKSSLTLLSNMLKKTTKNLSVELASHLPPVMGNYQRLEQVFINLIQNACQALPDPAKGIRIATFHDTENGSVVFEVSDEGTGIKAEDMPHITDPFFTTKRDSGGTGLGLSICATIVDQHGGSMTHESMPGAGTKAIIRLPAM